MNKFFYVMLTASLLGVASIDASDPGDEHDNKHPVTHNSNRVTHKIQPQVVIWDGVLVATVPICIDAQETDEDIPDLRRPGDLKAPIATDNPYYNDEVPGLEKTKEEVERKKANRMSSHL